MRTSGDKPGMAKSAPVAMSALTLSAVKLMLRNRTELRPGRIAKGLCALRAAFLRGPFRRANREANLPGPFVR